MRPLSKAIAGATVVGAACAAIAVAAGAPTATTQPAGNISATGATLNGQVAPNGTDTTYYFQYGTSTTYGGQTSTQGPLQGNANKSVAADVTGLSPSTTYHYRLVATSTAGTSNGQDQTFTTAAPGSSTGGAVTINASRSVVTFGGPVTISGAVAGPNGAGASVTLMQNPAPYTGGFQSTGQTTTANASGGYSFTIAPAANTRYEVVSKVKKPVTSSPVLVTVRVKVTLRASDLTPRRGQRVRFSGSVLPAHDGLLARIQRHTATGWRTVATAPLVGASPVAGGATRSTFAKRLRITRSATYRVRVVPTDGNHAAGNSPRRRLRVH